MVHLDLPHVRETNLHRILNGHNVARWIVKLVQDRVKGGRLAASGRAGYQQHPVRPADELFKIAGQAGGDAQFVEIDNRLRTQQQPQHDVLAADRGYRRHAHIDLNAVVSKAELSILRPASLRQIKVGHDFEPLNNARVHGQRRALALLKHAVYTVSQPQVILIGVDVHIARALIGGVGQELVDRRHHRMSGIVLGSVDLGLRRLSFDIRILSVAEAVCSGDERPKPLAIAQHRVDLAPGELPNLIHRLKVQRIVHRQCENVVDEE